tara:strand:- start:811 stop:1560 length:750 start_codon:yes stop_codon:yes gene_type:complete
MPTQDYTSASPNYGAKFTAQNRSSSVAATVTANEQSDRDNLLHFIEDKFKSGIKGSLTMENLRAFLHILVKSVRLQRDEGSFGVLTSQSMNISTSSASRFYFGSQTYGSSYHAWSQNTTAALSPTVFPSITGSYSNMGFDIPFNLSSFSCRGTMIHDGGTGVVDIKFYYLDGDENASSSLLNPVYIGQASVDCVVTRTGYAWSMTSVVPVPLGKKVFMFVRNTGHTASIEKLKVSFVMYYNTVSESFTI